MTKANTRRQKRKPATVIRQADKTATLQDLPLWIVTLIFLATTFIFFHSQLAGDTFFWDDIVEQYYPWQSFAARHLSDFSLPFWNPYSFSGMPFIADIQVGFFYPPNWLLSIFTDDSGLPFRALELIIILHFWLAQITMYLLARQWRISAGGAIIAAITFAFSGSMACHAFHPMIVYQLAWLPLIVRHMHRALTELRWQNAIYAGLLLGMTMLAGHPQTTLYILVFLVLMTLWYGLAALRSGDLAAKALGRFLGLASLAAFIGIGIFAVQLLQSRELAGLSERAEIDYETAAQGSLDYSQLFTAVIPKLFGASSASPAQEEVQFHLQGGDYYYYWETAFYFGIGALLLGIIAVRTERRSRSGGFLLFVSAFGLLFALGSNGPLFPVLFHMPYFGQFRFPSRILFFLSFAFALLGGMGFDAVMKRGRELMKTTLISGGALALVAGSAAIGLLLIIVSTPDQFFGLIQAYGLRALLFALFLTGLLWFGMRANAKYNLLIAFAVAAIAFIDLYGTYAEFNRSRESPDEAFDLAPPKKAAFQIQPPDSLFRVKMRHGGILEMKRNQGLLDNIMLFEGYNPLLLQRRIPPAQGEEDRYDLLNIRYAVIMDSVYGPGWVERSTRLGQAWMVYSAEVVDPTAMHDYMQNTRLDYRNTVVLEREPALPLANLPASEVEHRIRCLRYEHSRSEWEVESAAAGILCFSEIWYPAWQVYVDDQPAELLRSNFSQRAVSIPAGTHRVSMRYESQTFSLGAWISVLTALLSIGALLLIGRRQTQQKES